MRIANPSNSSASGEQINQALEKILASKVFVRAQRSRQLLQYLVEQTLAGNAHQLKGYTIGVAVFGREDDFDPQDDNIVRINGGRLREKLTEYYDSVEGEQTNVVIELPKRSYVPQFYLRADTQIVEPVSAEPELKTDIQPAPYSQTESEPELEPEIHVKSQSDSIDKSSPSTDIDNITAVESQHFEAQIKVNKRSLKPWLLLIGAAMALSIVATILLWPDKDKQTNVLTPGINVDRQLADSYFTQKAYDRALKYYLKAWQKDQKNTILLRQIARCQLNLNQIAEARDTLQQILLIENAAKD